MNGPQHYLEGEKRLAYAEQAYWDTPDDREIATTHALLAQAHFAAAQVATTIETSNRRVENEGEWREVTQ